MVHICRHLIGLVLASLLLLPSTAPYAQQTETPTKLPLEMREQLVKAAYIYNFAKFTTWPPNTIPPMGSALSLCIVGQDPIGKVAANLEEKTVQGRSVDVTYVVWAEEVTSCNIVFIGLKSADRMKELFSILQSKPILTISDMPGFTLNGGMLGLLEERGRINFEANQTAINTAGLRVSSRALQLAKRVRTGQNMGYAN